MKAKKVSPKVVMAAVAAINRDVIASCGNEDLFFTYMTSCILDTDGSLVQGVAMGDIQLWLSNGSVDEYDGKVPFERYLRALFIKKIKKFTTVLPGLKQSTGLGE